MAKKNFDVAEAQHVAENEAKTVEFTPNTSTEVKIKSLEDYKKEFDRLSQLFNKKKRFESGLLKLDSYEREVYDAKSEELESNEFRIILASGTYSDKEAVKISNIEVIKEVITFLKEKIVLKIENIETEILKAN